MALPLPSGWEVRKSRSDPTRDWYYKPSTGEKCSSLSQLRSVSHVSPTRHAFVWLVMRGDRYVPGALVSAYSARTTGTRSDLVVMVTPDVSLAARNLLASVFNVVVQVEYIKSSCIELNTGKKNKLYGSWKEVSFTKWRCLGFSQYKSVCLVDCDVIFEQNCDTLFTSTSAPAGCFVSPWHAPWNKANKRANPFKNATHGQVLRMEDVSNALIRGSVLIGACVVLPTSATLLNDFVEWLASNSPYGHRACSSMFDEQAITEFIIKKADMNWHYIDQQYTSIPWKKGEWLRGKEPMMSHYFGEQKPWEASAEEYEHDAVWWRLARGVVEEVGVDMVRKVSTCGTLVGESGEERDDVATHYDIAVQVRKMTTRDDDPIFSLRCLNNFVKNGLITTAINFAAQPPAGLHIVEFACGSGGDIRKYFYQATHEVGVPIRSIMGLDISSDCIKECGAVMRQKAGILHSSEGVVVDVDARVLDLSKKDAVSMYPSRLLQAGIVDVVGCQFALHYFCSSRSTLRAVLGSASFLLREGGMFICTTTNMKAMREVMEGLRDGGHANVRKKGEWSWDSDDSFGRAVQFDLGTSVVGAVEYLVDPFVLAEEAERVGLALVMRAPLVEVAEYMATHPYWRKAAKGMKVKVDRATHKLVLDDATIQTASLYDCYIFVKSSGFVPCPEVLRAARVAHGTMHTPTQTCEFE